MHVQGQAVMNSTWQQSGTGSLAGLPMMHSLLAPPACWYVKALRCMPSGSTFSAALANKQAVTLAQSDDTHDC